MSADNTKRLDHLDMVKGIGMFFVALGHMEDIATGTRVWISSFHMPLFLLYREYLWPLKTSRQWISDSRRGSVFAGSSYRICGFHSVILSSISEILILSTISIFARL